ncbi:MAG: Dabb family protein, partial [bacterium]
MFHHLVFFYLRKDLTAAQRSDFESKLRGLSRITSITSFTIGRPAPIERAVVDSTYDFAAMIHFKDKAGHDAYQIDQIHQDFIKDCK